MGARITGRHLLLIAGLACGVAGPNQRLFGALQTPADVPHARPLESDRVPRSFEENHGQSDASVRFLSRGHGYTLFLTSTEAVMSLRRSRDVQPHLLRLRPVGSNPKALISGESPLATTVNYIRGERPDESLSGLATYRRVKYEGIYPGVDLVYYDNGDTLEYDFIVAPGADPDRIRLEFSGLESMRLDDDGGLILGSASGELRQPAPVIYQDVDGVRTAIPGGYVLGSTHQLRFRIGAYDRNRPLVIDPVLAYSTYFGGGSEEVGTDIAVDAAGNAYVSGSWPSIRTPDAYDYDGFVAKFSPTGALLWVTGVGDRCNDQARGLALDGVGNVYVTGQIGGICYPYPTLNSGAFVAKLSALGAPRYILAFSDYWSGGSDVGQAVAVDSAGRAYVGGLTTSSAFPVTPGAFQQDFRGGADGFVVKVNATGTALLWSTFLGGTGFESLNDIALDNNGNAYVVGGTESQDFPTANALQPVHPGWGPVDMTGFVTKLTSDGTALVYSTYLGGGPTDIAQSVAVDAAGQAYVAGVTESSEFPITPGVVQPLPGDNRVCYYRLCNDAFVSKLSAAGNALVYSTYLGGSIFEEATGIAIDNGGSAYITGNTVSLDFPTVAAFQPNRAGNKDAFVAKLNPTASALVYSSYLGGSAQSTTSSEGEDFGLRIAVEPSGAAAYVIGSTYSPDFPVVNAYQPVFGGGLCTYSYFRCADAFIAKIGVGAACTYTISPATQAVGSAGGARTAAVDASSNVCPWTATSDVAWITITNGAAGTGDGPVGYTVAANNGAGRTGTLQIAGQTLTVAQSAGTQLPTVSVTGPNGGEKVFAATAYTITWTASGATMFDVAVSADGGAVYSPVQDCIGLAGNVRSCLWTTPKPLTANARIRVTARNAGGTVADASNAAFRIMDGAASIVVAFPNTAVNVGIGSTHVIKWNHNLGVESFVRVELSRDGGVTFPETLAAMHKNAKATTGSFDWRVTGPAMAAAQARIRVSWITGPVSDVSNTSFLIAPVFINVALPNATSRWVFDTTKTQAWTTNLGGRDRVNVQLSTTGINGAFATMTGGANVVANLRRANVVVPATPTSSGRVKVTWANPPAGFGAVGTNPANFTIGPPQ